MFFIPLLLSTAFASSQVGWYQPDFELIDPG